MEKAIAISISILSFLGMILIFFKNLSALKSLPEAKTELFLSKILKKLKTKISEIKFFQRPFWEILLEKNLQKVRILNLKIEGKIFNWIKKRREREIEKKNEDFWEKVKKEIK